MTRLIASLVLLLLSAGCQAGVLPACPTMGVREPHVRLWGPPENTGVTGNGGGGGGM
jgi:hypothetical protein